MRNPSRNTIKRLVRPANGACAGWAHAHTNYWFFNTLGARVYEISKGRIEHRHPGGFLLRYLTAAQRQTNARLTTW